METRERELFDYRDGKLYWKVSRGRITAGQEAGCLSEGNNYFLIQYDYKLKLLHRVIWAYHYGEIGKGVYIDHINRDPLDNRIENLRICNISQNQGNSKLNFNSTSGFKGVHMLKSGRFQAGINKQGKKFHLGTFDTAEEAHAAYLKAAGEYFGEFAHGG